MSVLNAVTPKSFPSNAHRHFGDLGLAGNFCSWSIVKYSDCPERGRDGLLFEVRVEYTSEQKVMTHNAKRDVSGAGIEPEQG